MRRALPILKICLLACCCLHPAGGRAECAAPPALEAQAKAHPVAQSYIALGKWFGRKGQSACSIEAFRAARKLDPHAPETLYLLGASLTYGGQPEEGASVLQQAVQAAPAVPEPRTVLAVALDELGRNAEAQVQWKTLLERNPHSTPALDGLAKSLLAGGNPSAAINLLQGVPKRNHDLTIDLAVAYDKVGHQDDAVELLSQALKATPADLELINGLVAVLVHQHHYQEAAELGAKAVQLHPGSVDAQRIYLRVLVLNGDTTAAPALGARLLEREPHNAEVLYLNGLIDLKNRNYEAARAHLSEALQLDPANANARASLGKVLGKLHDNAGAQEQLEKALAMGVDDPQVHFDLAGVLRAEGNTEQAQAQLKIYQETLQSQDRITVADSKSAQADQEMTKGNTQAALALYREAIEANPSSALITFKLAIALDKSGDTAGERTQLSKAVQLDPSLAAAQNQLGYLDSQDGNAAAAEQHFRLAVQSAPEYTQAWVSLAATLGSESKLPEAKQAIEAALKIEPDNAEALQLKRMLEQAAARH